MKKRFIALACALLVLMLSGCASPVAAYREDVLVTPYTAVYDVTAQTGSVSLAYTNTYSLFTEDGKLKLSGHAEAPYENDGVTGTETILIDETMVLENSGKATFGMPLTIEESFENSADPSQFRALSFKVEASSGSAILTTKKTGADGGAANDKVYSVHLPEQYFDKDALPFILYAFAGDNFTLNMTSGNRDSVQTVVCEKMGRESVTVGDTTYDCDCWRIRPNTVFSSYSARVWLSSDGVPVKVTQGTSQLLLREKTDYAPKTEE